MMTPDRPTDEEKGCVEALRVYRRYVARGVRGDNLTYAEESDLHELCDRLELPGWAMRRDIVAAKRWQTASSSRRVELLHVYPHLFSDEAEWARLFVANRNRRRRVTPEPEMTNAAGS